LGSPLETREEWGPALPEEGRARRAALFVADVSLTAFVFSSTVSITFEQVSIVVAFLAWSLSILLGARPGYKKGLLELSFALLLVVQLVSSLFSSRMAASLFHMRDLFFISVVYLFATLTRSEKRMKEFLFLFTAAATIMSVYGLSESAMGMDRIRATQSTPLTFSGILGIAFALGFAFVLLGADRREKLIVAPQLALIGAAIVMSHSRSSWIAVFCALLFIGIVKKRKLIPVLLALVALVLLVSPTSVRSRAASIFDLNEPSNRMRIILLESSPEVVKDHPIVGVGLIDLLPVFDEYVLPNVPEHLRGERLGHFHNNFVQVAVQTGILGLTIFIFVLFNIVRSEWEGYRTAGDRFLESVSLGSLAAFVAFLVNGMFEYNFGDSEVIMLVWFTLGLSIASRRLSRC
jgi:O-antigen ligase